jgi:hypothetical protein
MITRREASRHPYMLVSDTPSVSHDSDSVHGFAMAAVTRLSLADVEAIYPAYDFIVAMSSSSPLLDGVLVFGNFSCRQRETKSSDRFKRFTDTKRYVIQLRLTNVTGTTVVPIHGHPVYSRLPSDASICPRSGDRTFRFLSLYRRSCI